MGLDEMDVIFKLATSHKPDANTLFQAISGFKNSRSNRMDVIFKLATFPSLIAFIIRVHEKPIYRCIGGVA